MRGALRCACASSTLVWTHDQHDAVVGNHLLLPCSAMQAVLEGLKLNGTPTSSTGVLEVAYSRTCADVLEAPRCPSI